MVIRLLGRTQLKMDQTKQLGRRTSTGQNTRQTFIVGTFKAIKLVAEYNQTVLTEEHLML